MAGARSPVASDQAPASCRNCGAAGVGTYCPNGGQETSLALPPVRPFRRDAAGRYVALDGRMWRTIAALLFRPGYLAREYFAGRRRRYIRPARLFLVLSIALFALLRFASEPMLIEDELASAKPSEIAAGEGDQKDDGGLSLDPDLDLRMKFGAYPWLQPAHRRIDNFIRLS